MASKPREANYGLRQRLRVAAASSSTRQRALWSIAVRRLRGGRGGFSSTLRGPSVRRPQASRSWAHRGKKSLAVSEPSPRRRGAVGRGPEGGVSGLVQEEWDEEVVNEGPARDLEQRRRVEQHSERLRRQEDMMSSAAWAGPAFTGIGLRDHMPRVEEMFITNAAKLGRVPQAGEVEFVVLDITKKTLFLQSCVQAVVNRLRRSELVGASDMRMEVQVAGDPVQMVHGLGCSHVGRVREGAFQVLP